MTIFYAILGFFAVALMFTYFMYKKNADA